ncbi:MAG: SRPBCC family protein [Planctomycetes bacterium]|nr:SRPBCC family protein [Planctomycetota bacterium]
MRYKIVVDALIPTNCEILFDYVQDNMKRPEWDKSVISVERISEGDLKRGSILRLSCPGKFVWEGEYANFDRPNVTSVMMVKSSGIHPFKMLAGTWLYKQEEDSTRFSMICNYELKWGWFGSFLNVIFLKNKICKTMKLSIESLKQRFSKG